MCQLNELPGTLDPYAVFTLNGQLVFKSGAAKKTRNPEWNETFNTMVVRHYPPYSLVAYNRSPQVSRAGAEFEVEVFDWNQTGRDVSLGKATITLNDLEPFEGVERGLSLGRVGSVLLFLRFEPSVILGPRPAVAAVTPPAGASSGSATPKLPMNSPATPIPTKLTARRTQ